MVRSKIIFYLLQDGCSSSQFHRYVPKGSTLSEFVQVLHRGVDPPRNKRLRIIFDWVAVKELNFQLP